MPLSVLHRAKLCFIEQTLHIAPSICQGYSTCKFSWANVTTSFPFFFFFLFYPKVLGAVWMLSLGLTLPACHCFPHRVEFTDLLRDYCAVTAGTLGPHTHWSVLHRGLCTEVAGKGQHLQTACWLFLFLVERDNAAEKHKRLLRLSHC